MIIIMYVYIGSSRTVIERARFLLPGFRSLGRCGDRFTRYTVKFTICQIK